MTATLTRAAADNTAFADCLSQLERSRRADSLKIDEIVTSLTGTAAANKRAIHAAIAKLTDMLPERDRVAVIDTVLECIPTEIRTQEGSLLDISEEREAVTATSEALYVVLGESADQ